MLTMSERALRRRAEREARKSRPEAEAEFRGCEHCGKYRPVDKTYRICGRCQVRVLNLFVNLELMRDELARRSGLEDESRFAEEEIVLTDEEHASLNGQGPEVVS